MRSTRNIGHPRKRCGATPTHHRDRLAQSHVAFVFPRGLALTALRCSGAAGGRSFEPKPDCRSHGIAAGMGAHPADLRDSELVDGTQTLGLSDFERSLSREDFAAPFGGLDLLILRMQGGCEDENAKPVWFVLDELASLNKLPQLHTAVTENRKHGKPVGLGFQGRSQLEKRYGQDAEALLSQVATKVFSRPPSRARPSGSRRPSARSRSSA